MNPNLKGGSSISSNNLLIYSQEQTLITQSTLFNAVTAHLILNIGPEPIKTPLYQNWIHRRTALIQATIDGAAQK